MSMVAPTGSGAPSVRASKYQLPLNMGITFQNTARPGAAPPWASPGVSVSDRRCTVVRPGGVVTGNFYPRAKCRIELCPVRGFVWSESPTDKRLGGTYVSARDGRRGRDPFGH